MPHLFLVHIGPIQPFIASSRRTRDLWFGSTLLSELSKTAARVIEHDHDDNQLIFPAPLDPKKDLQINSQFSVSNRILAEIHSTPATLGNKIHTALLNQLRSLTRSVLEVIQQKTKNLQYKLDANTEDVIWQQIETLPEIFWVAVDTSSQATSTYEKQRERLEQLMAARKNTRLFDVGQGSNHPKSSIDGQLESVIPEDFYTQAKDQLYAVFNAGLKERLSGVDLLKRLGQFSANEDNKGKNNIFSTSHVAAYTYMSYLAKLPAGNQLATAKKHWRVYIDEIRSANIPKSERESALEELSWVPQHNILDRYDGAMLFPERLQDSISDPQVIKKISTKLETFLKHIDALGGRTLRPNPYYAILRADGDSMGKVIDYQAQQDNGQDQHRKLSQGLAAFSQQAKEIVQACGGFPIYTGGDDVLAFLPLQTVLPCAHTLAEAFHTQLHQFTDEDKKSATLSTGIVIVHHLSLLLSSLRLSADAEHKAKKIPGKNALALVLSKRSGEQYAIAGQRAQLYSYLIHLIPYFLSPLSNTDSPEHILSIPHGTAYEIRASAQRLTPRTPSNTSKEGESLVAALKADAIRILQRKLKLSLQGRSQEYREAVDNLLDLFRFRLGIYTKSSAPNHPHANIARVSVSEFVNELIIAQDLAEALDLSGITRLDFNRFITESVSVAQGGQA